MSHYCLHHHLKSCYFWHLHPRLGALNQALDEVDNLGAELQAVQKEIALLTPRRQAKAKERFDVE